MVFRCNEILQSTHFQVFGLQVIPKKSNHQRSIHQTSPEPHHTPCENGLLDTPLRLFAQARGTCQEAQELRPVALWSAVVGIASDGREDRKAKVVIGVDGKVFWDHPMRRNISR